MTNEINGFGLCYLVAEQSHCAERLSDYKMPDFFTFQAEPLPRNANGKLMKRHLRDLVAKNDLTRAANQSGDRDLDATSEVGHASLGDVKPRGN